MQTTMKAQELRIGNFVWEPYSGEMIVHVIDDDGLCDLSHMKMNGIGLKGRYMMNALKGIPLTEEWLIKFGFENRKYVHSDKSESGDLWLTKNNIWAIHVYEDNFNLFNMDRHEGSRLIASMKHVHTLQNLIFALTGTELTLTP